MSAVHTLWEKPKPEVTQNGGSELQLLCNFNKEQ